MDSYDKITDMLVNMTDAAGEWKPPWRMSGLHKHRNAITERPYSGINVLLLWAHQEVNSYEYPLWATLKQWNSKGIMINKGEKGTPIIFFDKIMKQINGGEDEYSYSLAKTHYVYNASQVTGFSIKQDETTLPHNHIEHLEEFIKNTEAKIKIQGDRAFYVPSKDEVTMPSIGLFKSPESYYSVMFHELTHWTGAKHRLDRELSGFKGFKSSYAFEELIAELGAAYLSSDFNIINEVKEDNAQYLHHWRNAMKEDSKIIFKAASYASRAVSYMHELNKIEQKEAA